jgi:hypothetical protein
MRFNFKLAVVRVILTRQPVFFIIFLGTRAGCALQLLAAAIECIQGIPNNLRYRLHLLAGKPRLWGFRCHPWCKIEQKIKGEAWPSEFL